MIELARYVARETVLPPRDEGNVNRLFQLVMAWHVHRSQMPRTFLAHLISWLLNAFDSLPSEGPEIQRSFVKASDSNGGYAITIEVIHTGDADALPDLLVDMIDAQYSMLTEDINAEVPVYENVVASLPPEKLRAAGILNLQIVPLVGWFQRWDED